MERFSSVTRLVWLFETPWTAAHQASLSITNSRSLLKFMSIVSMMPSNHLILCLPFSFCLQSFPASGSFQMSWFFTSGGQSIGASASASVLPSVALQIPSSISNVDVHSLPLAKALKSQLPLEWPGRLIKLASSWAHLPHEILLQSFHVGPQEGHPLHSNK